jgi:hypothetical protein
MILMIHGRRRGGDQRRTRRDGRATGAGFCATRSTSSIQAGGDAVQILGLRKGSRVPRGVAESLSAAGPRALIVVVVGFVLLPPSVFSSVGVVAVRVVLKIRARTAILKLYYHTWCIQMARSKFQM